MCTPYTFFVRTNFGDYLRILYNCERQSGLKFSQTFEESICHIIDEYSKIEQLAIQYNITPNEGSELDILYAKLREIVDWYITCVEQFLLIDRFNKDDPHLARFISLTDKWNCYEIISPSRLIVEISSYVATCLKNFRRELEALKP